MILLLGAGLIAGLVNAVAGGGALLVYPLLISFGLPPIVANASTTLTLWPGALSSAYGYRQSIRKIPKAYFFLLIPSAIGGLIGAIILRKTSNHVFSQIVPLLMLAGVLLIALQPVIHKKLLKTRGKSSKTSTLNIVLVAIPLFALAIYGGYFGAGFGIVMLALLGLTRLTNIHQMNGLKNLSGASINIVASVYFIAYGLVNWKYIPILLVGSILGGYLGSTYSNKLPTAVIRGFIIIAGIAVAAYLFFK